MSMIACSDESLRIDPSGGGEMQGRTRAAGLAFSVILHGLALFWLLIVGPYGTQGSQGGLHIVPIEVELIGEDTTPSTPQRAAALPKQDATQQPSDPAPDGTAPPTRPPLADALETKLQALAQLRQPNTSTPNDVNGSGIPDRVATTEDLASGGAGLLSVKDFIRAQVERRWNLDLATLGDHQFSVPIHVEISSGGTVIKAEIMDTARSNDPAYREVAVSARNAVLLSSPLSLPPGHYQEVMDMVLYLNPRDALR
jgi:hypothetical protein